MSEEEILNIMNKLGNIYNELKKDDVEGHSSAYEMQFEDFKAIQGLLDLYQKEKEKNKRIKNSTLIVVGRRNGKDFERKLVLEQYIHKDKIKEIIYPTPTNLISYEIQTSDMYKKILELLGEE